jgi:hypothetical protein
MMRYAKAAIAVLYAVMTAFFAVYGTPRWAYVAAAAMSALTVYLVPNTTAAAPASSPPAASPAPPAGQTGH